MPDHVFEHLGRPPYRIIGFESAQGARMIGCHHCGTGILEKYVIASSDGRTFKVGNQCVYKAGDAGLRRAVNELRRQARQASQDVAAAWAAEQLARPEIQATLDALPHPLGFAGSALTWACWMLKNAGRSGKAKVARFIRHNMAPQTR